MHAQLLLYLYRPSDDWALIELETTTSDVTPLNWSALDQETLDLALHSGAKVVVAGYPALRPHALSVDFDCGEPEFQAQGKLLAQRCATMKGDSGAPVLLLRDGAATVIAVHSGGTAGADGDITPLSTPVSAFQNVLNRLSTRPPPADRAQ